MVKNFIGGVGKRRNYELRKRKDAHRKEKTKKEKPKTEFPKKS